MYRYKKEQDFEKKSHGQSKRLEPLVNRRIDNKSNDFRFDTPDRKNSTIGFESMGNKISIPSITESQKKKLTKATRNLDEKLNRSRDNSNSINNSYTRSYKDQNNHSLMTEVKGNTQLYKRCRRHKFNR